MSNVGKHVWVLERESVHEYEIAKETPLMFKVMGVSGSAYSSQLYKDKRNFYFDRESAIEAYKQKLREQISRAQERMIEADSLPAKRQY